MARTRWSSRRSIVAESYGDWTIIPDSPRQLLFSASQHDHATLASLPEGRLAFLIGLAYQFGSRLDGICKSCTRCLATPRRSRCHRGGDSRCRVSKAVSSRHCRTTSAMHTHAARVMIQLWRCRPVQLERRSINAMKQHKEGDTSSRRRARRSVSLLYPSPASRRIPILDGLGFREF